MARIIILFLICMSNTMSLSAGIPDGTALDTVAVNLDSVEHASCPGEADGAAFVSVTAGTAPFTFLWSNGDTLKNADSLAAGIYGLTVTDADGDQAVLDGIEIGEPAPLKSL
ncbi:MAG: SprB repeat-containing protein [Saprospiraceae bacterium]|nr:SprB repeat-containing protein [Saprospiraceae bacterium]